jgi:hypothetical protein
MHHARQKSSCPPGTTQKYFFQIGLFAQTSFNGLARNFTSYA